MPDTVAGLFRTRSEADLALRKLKEAGFGPDQVSVSTPRIGRRGHYGRKQFAGVAIGVVVGVVLGMLAVAVFGTHGAGSVWLAYGIGAFTGGVTGGLAGSVLSMAAAGDRALYYEQEVEAGRTLITVAGPRLEEAQVILREAGAMEAAPIEAPLEESGRPRPEGG